MSECVLCEQRERYEAPGLSKRTTWALVRNGPRDWSIDVTIENTKLGIAMVASVPVDYCPDCGKELA